MDLPIKKWGLSIVMLVYQRVQYLVNVDLVSGFDPSEKYESQFGLLFPIWKNKKCSNPPTSDVGRFRRKLSHL